MTMKSTRRLMIAAGLAATFMQPFGTAAYATETINMIAIDGYPDKSMWVKEFSTFFIPRVNEELAKTGNYEIKWQEAYGGTIVKPRGVLEGIKLGLGDIGIVTTIFHTSALPSQGIAAVTPFVSSDARIVAKAVDEIAKEFPQVEKEFAAENQVYLATGVVLDTYQIFSTSPISSVADLEGKKVAAAGYNLRYLEGIEGAAGVQGGLPTFYNMVQTGVTEAAMLWPEAALTYNMVEVAPYMLKADLGAVNSKTLTINADVWAKLPEEVKTVIQNTAIEYSDRLAEVAMGEAAESVAGFIAGGGTVVEMTEEQRKAWADSMPNIAVEWATKLDSEGAPGSEMLRAYMAKLAAAGAVPLRDWAAELPN
ncbi:C4-dicarboxylate TRAP transporter substrate-binding protein [Falsihalocynthiibacter sp. S25ZX9]|uniref:C4-dicarboxylate TRAP transporter substrate-binding protein n=1 Tax=Falsihalocynthiibacter sp. S25ZX9 TaxID=3240870 RepID=UPI00350F2D7C